MTAPRCITTCQTQHLHELSGCSRRSARASANPRHNRGFQHGSQDRKDSRLIQPGEPRNHSDNTVISVVAMGRSLVRWTSGNKVPFLHPMKTPSGSPAEYDIPRDHCSSKVHVYVGSDVSQRLIANCTHLRTARYATVQVNTGHHGPHDSVHLYFPEL